MPRCEISESGATVWILSLQEPTANPPMKVALAERAWSLFLAPKRGRNPSIDEIADDPVRDLWPDGLDNGGER
jgi:hypothetical protein